MHGARGTKNKVTKRVVSVEKLAKNYKFGSRQGTVEVATLQKLTMMFFLLFAFSHAASTALVYPDHESGVFESESSLSQWQSACEPPGVNI